MQHNAPRRGFSITILLIAAATLAMFSTSASSDGQDASADQPVGEVLGTSIIREAAMERPETGRTMAMLPDPVRESAMTTLTRHSPTSASNSSVSTSVSATSSESGALGGAPSPDGQSAEALQGATAGGDIVAATVQNVTLADPTGVDVGLPAQFPVDRISGHDIEGLNISYDDVTDVLTITIDTYVIAGDVDGDGDPGGTGPILASLTGTDQPNFGGQESFAVLLDIDQDGTFDIIAGVHSTTDLSGYQVARLANPLFAAVPSLSIAYGTTLPQHNGGTPASPSAGSPNLTIVINSFSQIDPNDASLDFGVNAFMGSLDDAGIGEDFMPGNAVPVQVELDARIGDYVWIDANSNGVQDAGEQPVTNQTVRLLDDNDAVVQTTTTGADGRYQFIVRPGTYRVQFTLPDDHIFTDPNEGSDDDIDSDAATTNGNTSQVTVSAGDNVTNIDAGVVPIDAEVTLEKHTNGLDSDTAPGATLETGSTATFTYIVENTGNVPLTNVRITDNREGTICTLQDLAVNATERCTATRTVTPGPYANVGTVVATPVANGVQRADINDTDPSHHQGTIVATIDLEKATNGQDADDAPGPSVEPGSTVTFTYVVRNTGNVPLTNVRIVDDIEGPICTIDDLAVGASSECTETATAGFGPYRNLGTATGTPVVGQTQLDDISDNDPSNHVGTIRPSVDIEKATNGSDADSAPGPAIAPGDTATFTYVVTNDGNTPLTNLVVTDDQEGQICVIASLAAGASDQCTASITVTLGQYTNIGSVAATPVVNGNSLDNVSDSDPSNHLGREPGPVCVANIHGPRMYAGATTEWNTGYVAAAGSVVRVVTSEPGGSPSQPNERVYVRVGQTLYGPSPAGLGELVFTTADGGAVTVLHWSAVTGDVSMPNSVEVAICGTALSLPSCGADHVGPRMWAGSTVTWNSGLTAAAGSLIRVTTTEPGGSPSQPNEQVYVQVGQTVYGPTPAGLGTLEFIVGEAGPVTVLHYSVVTGDTSMPNSVEFTICGSNLS